MSMPLQTYIGFANGACRSTRNISSAAWVIYLPSDELVSMHGVSLGQTTNNIAEYSAVIELLSESISFGIRRLIVRLDSELVVLQLNRFYAIRNPVLLRLFLRVRLLEREFNYIEYHHIPKVSKYISRCNCFSSIRQTFEIIVNLKTFHHTCEKDKSVK